MHQIGESVSYEDMANPREHGTIIAKAEDFVHGDLRIDGGWTIRWDDGRVSNSDLRQAGWKGAAW